MKDIDYLVAKYDKQRIPYEDRGKDYDKQRKRETRQKELQTLTGELLTECQGYKKLQLTPYQELRVRFLVNHFGNDFKMLHGQAKTEAIITEHNPQAELQAMNLRNIRKAFRKRRTAAENLRLFPKKETEAVLPKAPNPKAESNFSDNQKYLRQGRRYFFRLSFIFLTNEGS